MLYSSHLFSPVMSSISMCHKNVHKNNTNVLNSWCAQIVPNYNQDEDA